MSKKPAVFNWSTGKDSALALYRCLQEDRLDIRCLLTTVNSEYGRVSQHGIREELLCRQAESIGIPLKRIQLPGRLDMDTYSAVMRREWEKLMEESIEVAVFGDIYLNRLREYREKQLAGYDVRAEFPLWKQNTDTLARRFIDFGFKAVVASVSSEYLDESFAGRLYDADFLKDLPPAVDPCGEQGEFHTFVYDGPVFKKPVKWRRGKKVFRKYQNENSSDSEICGSSEVKKDIGMWFCDIILE